MKKIISVLLVLICFFSCSNPSNLPTPMEETYLVEFGVITNQTYESTQNTISHLTEPTYSDFKVLRNYLYSRTISDYSSRVWTINEIYQYLLPRVDSSYELNEQIRLIQSNGYYISFFYHRFEKDKKWYMCISLN